MPEAEDGALLVAGVTRIEESEYVRALRGHPMQRRATAVVVGLGVLSLLSAGWSVVAATSATWTVVSLAFGLLASYVAWKLWNAGSDQWRALAEWQRQVRFELFEHRLRIRTERTSVDYEWSVFDPFVEVASAFIVYLPAQVAAGRPMVIIMPKNAFAEDEVDLVRDALHERIRSTPHPPAKKARGFLWKTLLLWILLILMFVAIFLLTNEPASAPNAPAESTGEW